MSSGIGTASTPAGRAESRLNAQEASAMTRKPWMKSMRGWSRTYWNSSACSALTLPNWWISTHNIEQQQAEGSTQNLAPGPPACHMAAEHLVGEVGLEPTRPKPHAPKACASAIPPLPHCCRNSSLASANPARSTESRPRMLDSACLRHRIGAQLTRNPMVGGET